MSNRTRFPELDLLRFLAASAVLLYHFIYRGPLSDAWPQSISLLGRISKYGYLGVDVFFILSGFVILLTACRKDAAGFVQARILRLYPAYWICVTLTTIGIVLAGKEAITPSRYLANLTMIHGFLGISDISGVYWSLAVELKFYLVIFLILVFRQIERLALLLGVWLAVCSWLSLHDSNGVVRFFLFPEWSSYFIGGAMLFLIHRDGPSAYKLTIVAGCYVLSLAYAIGWAPVGGGAMEPDTDGWVLAGLLGFFYLLFMGIALRPRHPQVSSRFCLLGLITYPLYLLHQDLGFILLRSAPQTANRYALLVMAFGAMVGLSWLVHIGPERWLAARLKACFGFLGTMARSLRFAGFYERLPANPGAPAVAPVLSLAEQSNPTMPQRAPARGK